MACGSSGLLPHLPRIPMETVTPQAHAHLFLSTAGLLGEWQVTAAGSHVADEPRNMFMFGENFLVSTEIAHEVGGDSAEVNGQDVPVIVGEGSPTGKAVVAGRAGRVVTA